MTVVIGQIRGEEILLLADTKVSEPDKTRPDVIPGRLKIVALGNRFTVAYAGDADPAFIALKQAQRFVAANDREGAIECLKDWSGRHDIEFIVATHDSSARLRRIRNRVALDAADVCMIGDKEPFRTEVDAAPQKEIGTPLSHGYLRDRFIDRFLTNKRLGDHIGGFPTALHATQAGHRYLMCSGFYTFKFPRMMWGETTYQSMEEIYSGEGHLQWSLMPIDATDVPVMGACMLQARTGFVYSPLLDPLARPVKLIDVKQWEGLEKDMYAVLRAELTKEAIRVQKVLEL